MTGKVIIIVPTQGQATGWFMAGARKLKQHVYPRATIVRTKIIESGSTAKVKFTTVGGEDFSWENVTGVSRVLTISHGAYGDGPNLAYGDSNVKEHQPWGRAGVLSNELGTVGKNFWLSVSNAMRADGKIIFVGCGMAPGYGSIVARLTGKHTYGATDHVAAAVPASVLKHVEAFEQGQGGAIVRARP